MASIETYKGFKAFTPAPTEDGGAMLNFNFRKMADEFETLAAEVDSVDGDLFSHTSNTSNPHSVTATQVGNTTAQWNANLLQGRTVASTAPTNSQVLTWNSTSSEWEPSASSGGLNNVVEDTTPQLGGALDVNGNSIGNTGSAVTFTDEPEADFYTLLEGGVGKGSMSGNTSNIAFAGNAYHDGSWNRFDVSRYTVLNQLYHDATGANFQVWFSAPAANPISNWAQALDIDESGNVGIGTSSQGEKLEVSGNIQLTSDNDQLMFGTGEDAFVYFDGTNIVTDIQSSGSRQVVQVPASNGNVPSTFVNYNPGTGTGTGTGFLFAAGSVSTFVGGVSAVRTDAASNSKIYLRTLTNGSLTGDSNSHFYVQGGNSSSAEVQVNAARLRVTGRDGAPTLPSINPATEALVTNNDTLLAALISGTSDVAAISFGDTDEQIQGYLRYDNADDSMRIWTNNAERVAIDSAGNVGIGTTDPAALLHVNGTALFEGNVTFGANSTLNITGLDGGSSGITLEGAQVSLLTNLATNGYWISNDGDNEGIFIDGGGKVGIGTTPTGTLDVSYSGVAGDGLIITNTSATGFAELQMVNTSAQKGQIFKTSVSYTPYKNIGAGDLGFYNSAGGNFSFLNDNASGNINFAAGGSSVAQVTIASTGDVSIGSTTPVLSQSGGPFKFSVTSDDSLTAAFMNTQTSGVTGAGMIGYCNDGAALASGDRLGFFLLGGSTDASDTLANAAGMLAYTTENWSGSQNGAELRFAITANGETSRTEAMILGHDGTLSLDGTFDVNAITSSSPKFLRFYNNADTYIGVMDESSSSDGGGLRFRGYREANSGVGMNFAGVLNTDANELCAVYFNGYQATGPEETASALTTTPVAIFANNGTALLTVKADGDVDFQGNNLDDVASIDGGGDAIQFDDEIKIVDGHITVSTTGVTNYGFMVEDDDVLHTFTGIGGAYAAINATTAGFFATASATDGGLAIAGFRDTDSSSLAFNAHSDTTGFTGDAVKVQAWESDGGTGRTAITGGNIIAFSAGSTPLVTIDYAGNVGIGTTDPDAALHVNGTALFEGNVTFGANSTLNVTGLDGGSSGITLEGAQVSLLTNLATNGYWISNDGDNEGIYIDESGNVGIGTASPTQMLEVANDGNTNIAATRYSNDVGGSAFVLQKARGTQSAPAAVQAGDAIFNLSAAGYTSGGSFKLNATTIQAYAAEGFTAIANGAYLTFNTTPIGSTTRAERVRIDDAGRVGIGTTDPSTTDLGWNPSGSVINVRSTSGPARLVAEGTSALFGFIASGAAADKKLWLFGPDGTDDFLIRSYDDALSSNVEHLTIDHTGDMALQKDSGNVGIGTTTPAAGLDVANGRIRVTSNTTPTTGEGLEFGYDGTKGIILGYDWDGVAYKDVRYNGLEHEFFVSGISVATIGSNVLTVETTSTTAIVTSDSSGKATSLFAGAVVSSFQFDDSGDFVIRSDSNANVLSGSGTGNIHIQCGSDGQTIVGLNQVGIETYLNSRLSVLSDTASDIGLIVRGATSQTANLQEWQNSIGTVLNVVDKDGNVGIGTTDPDALLHVNGTALFEGNVTFGANSTLNVTGLDGGSSGITLEGAQVSLLTNLATNGYWISNDGDSEGIFIDGGGFVGIGTDSPTSKLTFAESTSGDGGIDFGSDVSLYRNTTARIRLDGSLQVNGSIYGSNSLFLRAQSGSSTFINDNTAGDVILASGGGDVGIGTTSPAALLHVNGSSLFEGNLTVGSNADILLSGGSIDGGSAGVSIEGAQVDINAPTEMLSAAFKSEVDNGNSGTGTTINWLEGNKQAITLNDNVTLTFAAPTGPTNLTLKITQDVGGTNTVTWPGSVQWAGGSAPTITATGDAVDIVSLYYDGTNYYGAIAQDFS